MKIFPVLIWLIGIFVSVSKSTENYYPTNLKNLDSADYGDFFEKLLSEFGNSNTASDGYDTLHDDSPTHNSLSSASPNNDHFAYTPSGYNSTVNDTFNSDSISRHSSTTGAQGSSTRVSSSFRQPSASTGTEGSTSESSGSPGYFFKTGSKTADVDTTSLKSNDSAHSASKVSSYETPIPTGYLPAHSRSSGSSYNIHASPGYQPAYSSPSASSSNTPGSTGYQPVYGGLSDSSSKTPGSAAYRPAYSGSTGFSYNTYGSAGLNTAGLHTTNYGSENVGTGSENSVPGSFAPYGYGASSGGFKGYGRTSFSSSDHGAYELGMPGFGSFDVDPIATGDNTGLEHITNPGRLVPTAIDSIGKDKKEGVEQVTWKNEYRGHVNVEQRIKDNGNFSDSAFDLSSHGNVDEEIVDGKIFRAGNEFTWTDHKTPGSFVHIKYPGDDNFVKTKHTESKRKTEQEIHTIEVVLENKHRLDSGVSGHTHGHGQGHGITAGKDKGTNSATENKDMQLQKIIKSCWSSLPTCPNTCQNTTIECKDIFKIAGWPECVERVDGLANELKSYFKQGVSEIFNSISRGAQSIINFG